MDFGFEQIAIIGIDKVFPKDSISLTSELSPDLEKMITVARKKSGGSHTSTNPLPPITVSELEEKIEAVKEEEVIRPQNTPTAEEVFGTVKRAIEEENEPQINSEDVFGVGQNNNTNSSEA